MARAKDKKENMFGSFAPAVQARQQEQQQIEAVVTGKPAQPGAVGRPRKRQDTTTITLSISAADKQRVKAYAFANSVTVSDLLHQWIMENCAE